MAWVSPERRCFVEGHQSAGRPCRRPRKPFGAGAPLRPSSEDRSMPDPADARCACRGSIPRPMHGTGQPLRSCRPPRYERHAPLMPILDMIFRSPASIALAILSDPRTRSRLPIADQSPRSMPDPQSSSSRARYALTVVAPQPDEHGKVVHDRRTPPTRTFSEREGAAAALTRQPAMHRSRSQGSSSIGHTCFVRDVIDLSEPGESGAAERTASSACSADADRMASSNAVLLPTR